jgi:hypothetical protein
MTEREIEERKIRYAISGGICEVCGKPIYDQQPQIAHCIADTKANNAKYGWFFVQHHLNYKAVCSLACNQSCNIGQNPGKVLDKLAEICIYEIKKHNGQIN